MKAATDSSLLRPAIAAVSVVVLAIAIWFAVRGPHDEFATLSGHRNGVFSMALCPDGKTAASGGGEGNVRIWNLSDRRAKAVLTGHVGRVYGLAWSPDATMIATGGDDKSIRLWNVESGQEIQAWKNLARPVRALAFSSDGTILAAAVDQDVYWWTLNQSRPLRILRGHQRTISGLAFRPNTLELVTFASDQTVRIWDLSKQRQVASMPGPMGHCFGLTVSADGKLAACVGGGRVHLYNLENRQPTEAIEPNARIICGAAFSPDGRTLAIGSQDKEVVLWDVPQKQQRSKLNGHNQSVGQMAFLPDGETLLTCSHDSSLKLWKVR